MSDEGSNISGYDNGGYDINTYSADALQLPDPSVIPSAVPTQAPANGNNNSNTSSSVDLTKIDPKDWNTMLKNGLVTASDIMEAQEKLKMPKKDTADWDGPPKTGKGLKDMFTGLGMPDSLEDAFGDMQEAVLGIARDLSSGEKKSLRDVLTEGDRMRGLGLILVLVAIVGLIVVALVAEE